MPAVIDIQLGNYYCIMAALQALSLEMTSKANLRITGRLKAVLQVKTRWK